MPQPAKRARAEPVAIPAFKTSAVYNRPADFVPNVGADAPVTNDYVLHAYQYATSSAPKTVQPASIIVPGEHFADDVTLPNRYTNMVDDVKAAVDFAYANQLAVALRSGGHSFSGYSSTDGDNIQLDMKNFKRVTWSHDMKQITAGTATFLGDLDAELFAHEAFLPHGHCCTVCVGGHSSTLPLIPTS